MNRVAFSNFAQFIDRWDPEVQIHDDLIDGRFHSNTEIRVSRDRGVKPVFNGKVTLAARRRAHRRRRLSESTHDVPCRDRDQRAAHRAAAARGDVSSTAQCPPIACTVSRAIRCSRSTRTAVRLARALDERGIGERRHARRRAFLSRRQRRRRLHVRGTVNGKVLVYSPQRIVVVDDLRYAADPRAPGADDYLGLVAESTVEIDEPEVTGSGDLELHASIYARNRFRRDPEQLRCHGAAASTLRDESIRLATSRAGLRSAIA